MTLGVHRRSLHTAVTAAEAFDSLFSSNAPAVWLDSLGERGTGKSVLASGELVELALGDELAQLRQLWAKNFSSVTGASGAPLGVVGWLSYEITEDTLGIPGIRSTTDPAQSRVLLVTRSIEVDEATGHATAWGLGESEDFDRWCEAVEQALSTPTAGSKTPTAPPVQAQWRDHPERYRQMIAEAIEAIRDGEVYQLCLTTEVSVETALSDTDIHLLLRELSPTHHQGLLRLGDISLVSSSPETFLTVSADGLVTTRPIKGTRPRGVDPEIDRRLAAELVDSEKERAENLMIVDLMRNDLQRVCATGSVQVTGLFDVETYSSVHQLVSTVTGELATDKDGVDVLAACFPAGSMTGAPKHRAVTLIRDVESAPRGIYSGAWGWWYADGSMEWAMTIRSVVLSSGTARIGVGGGITWSSEIDQEIAEVGHKARRILEALSASSGQYS